LYQGSGEISHINSQDEAEGITSRIVKVCLSKTPEAPPHFHLRLPYFLFSEVQIAHSNGRSDMHDTKEKVESNIWCAKICFMGDSGLEKEEEDEKNMQKRGCWAY
jgi:hypothetical protein